MANYDDTVANINKLIGYLRIKYGTPFAQPINIVTEALKLIKEQKEIIDRYHTADSFLEAHGWKWDEN